jgi:hypothetical protein
MNSRGEDRIHGSFSKFNQGKATFFLAFVGHYVATGDSENLLELFIFQNGSPNASGYFVF